MARKRTFGAMFGALLLTLGMAGPALAEVLIEDHEAIIAGWDSDGDPFARDKFGDPLPINGGVCDKVPLDAGEIAFFFHQAGGGQDTTTPNPGGASANTLDVDLNDGEIFLTDVEAFSLEQDVVNWQVTVDPPGDDLELVSANSNVDGGELAVLTICFFQDRETATAGATPEAPGDGVWPLVLALGILLASVVLFSPARRTVEVPVER